MNNIMETIIKILNSKIFYSIKNEEISLPIIPRNQPVGKQFTNLLFSPFSFRYRFKYPFRAITYSSNACNPLGVRCSSVLG